MKSSKSYKCPTCGKMHEDWPAIAFDSPTGYNVLPENIKNEIGSLANDFCIIHHPEQTDRFIRATLALKVVDQCENLEYGVWVSLSEKNFHDYKNNYNNPNHEAKYFGWLCNDIPEYEIIENIPTTVFTRTNGQRPEIIPHQDFDHSLVHDYYNGITKIEAENRIEKMLKVINDRSKPDTIKKIGWKFW